MKDVTLAVSFHYADDDCFHNHEWECHGTCSGLSQPDYFKDVIDLHKTANIAVSHSHMQLLKRSEHARGAKYTHIH